MSFSSNSVQGRITNQIAENLRQRAEQKLADTQNELSMERAERIKETLAADELFKAILDKVDVLLEFIVQRCGELPPDLLELIAERQEQRIEATLPAADIDPSNTDAVASVLGRSANAGQILRVSGTALEFVDSDGLKPKSLTTIRREVQQLLRTMKYR